MNRKKNSLILIAALAFAMVMMTPVSAASNWSQENGTWYYNKDGSRQMGWITDGGKKYYMGTDGVMKTGWQLINGDWYYFRENGMMHTGWWKDNGNWYYMKLDGAMLANATAPDGHLMKADGIWNSEIVDPKVTIYNEVGIGKYIVNWETDNELLLGGGNHDIRIVSALLNRCELSELNEKDLAVYHVVKNFVDSEIKDTDSDYDKVVKITKFIWQKAEYSDHHGTPYELLIEGKGLCNAYSRTFKIMANAVGLECYCINSPVHGWNMVQVDGEWYNVDTTESLNGLSASEAKYVLRCDAEYARSAYKVTKSPECTATKYTKSNINE